MSVLGVYFSPSMPSQTALAEYHTLTRIIHLSYRLSLAEYHTLTLIIHLSYRLSLAEYHALTRIIHLSYRLRLAEYHTLRLAGRAHCIGPGDVTRRAHCIGPGLCSLTDITM